MKKLLSLVAHVVAILADNAAAHLAARAGAVLGNTLIFAKVGIGASRVKDTFGVDQKQATGKSMNRIMGASSKDAIGARGCEPGANKLGHQQDGEAVREHDDFGARLSRDAASNSRAARRRARGLGD
jgi:hypothetical protein